jgi:hypothetical protein
MHLLQTFLNRPSAERRLIVRATALVALVRLGLWVLPYKRVRELVVRPPAARAADEPRRTADEIARAVIAVSRRIPKASCLTQALAAQRLLAREGHDARVTIGVARSEEGVFEAHAWLEHGGRVLVVDDPDLARFTPLQEGRATPRVDGGSRTGRDPRVRRGPRAQRGP